MNDYCLWNEGPLQSIVCRLHVLVHHHDGADVEFPPFFPGPGKDFWPALGVTNGRYLGVDAF